MDLFDDVLFEAHELLDEQRKNCAGWPYFEDEQGDRVFQTTAEPHIAGKANLERNTGRTTTSAIAIGMDETNLTSRLGKPDEKPSFDDGVSFLCYLGLGVSIRLVNDKATVVFLYSGVVGGYEKGKNKRFNGALPGNLTFETSYDEVIRILGAPEESGELDMAPVPSRWISYNSLGLGFDFVTRTGRIITLNLKSPGNPARALRFGYNVAAIQVTSGGEAGPQNSPGAGQTPVANVGKGGEETGEGLGAAPASPPPAVISPLPPASEPGAEATASELPDFPPLWEHCEPDLFARNAFRLLELPVTASEREIAKRREWMEKAAKNNLAAPPGPARWLPRMLPATDHEVRECAHQIQDLQRRLLHEFFWFWALDENADPRSDEPLRLLAAGDAAGAVKLWEKLADGAERGAAARHNLGIYHLVQALDAEQALLATHDSNLARQAAAAWAEAHKHWGLAVQEPRLWSRVTNRIRTFADASLPTGVARRLEASLPAGLLLLNARLALRYQHAGQAEAAHRQAGLLQGRAGFPQAAVETAQRLALAPLRRHLKSRCESAERDAQADPRRGAALAEELLRAAELDLPSLQLLLDAGHPLLQAERDRLATAVLVCQVAYGNKTEDWKTSIRLLERALPLAGSATVREKMQKNLETVRGHAAETNWWRDPAYWDCPENVVEELERAEGELKAGNDEAVIAKLAKVLRQCTEGELPAQHRPVFERCLAYALISRALRLDREAWTVYNEDPPFLRRVKNKVQDTPNHELRRYIPDITGTDYYSSLYCLCCGTSIVGTFYRWKAKLVGLNRDAACCPSCNSTFNDQLRDQERVRNRALEGLLEMLMLAAELNAGSLQLAKNRDAFLEQAKRLSLHLPADTLALRLSLGLCDLPSAVRAVDSGDAAAVAGGRRWLRDMTATTLGDTAELCKVLGDARSEGLKALLEAIGRLGAAAAPALEILLPLLLVRAELRATCLRNERANGLLVGIDRNWTQRPSVLAMIPEWSRALGDADERSEAAVEIFVALGAEHAGGVQALTQTLKEGTGRAAVNATRALGWMGSRSCQPEIVAALPRLLAALPEVSAKTAEEVLQTMTDMGVAWSEHPSLRELVERLLAPLGEKPSAGAATDLLVVLGNVPFVVERLAEVATGPKEDAALAALGCLLRMESRAAVAADRIVGLLETTDPERCAAAIAVLEKIDSQWRERAVVRELSDKLWRRILAPADEQTPRALERLVTLEAADKICCEILREPVCAGGGALAVNAVRALGKKGSRRYQAEIEAALPRLIAALPDVKVKNAEEMLRTLTGMGVAWSEHPALRELVERLLAKLDEWASAGAAANLLVFLGNVPIIIERLTEVANGTNEGAAVAALACLRRMEGTAAAAVDRIVGLLSCPVSDLRVAALTALNKIDPRWRQRAAAKAVADRLALQLKRLFGWSPWMPAMLKEIDIDCTRMHRLERRRTALLCLLGGAIAAVAIVATVVGRRHHTAQPEVQYAKGVELAAAENPAAVAALERAAAQGHARAAVALAQMLAKGGVWLADADKARSEALPALDRRLADPDKAIRLFRQALAPTGPIGALDAMERTQAELALARLLQAKPEAAANAQELAGLLAAVASTGNADDWRAVGAAYAAGRGLPKSESEALPWYRRAAEKGDQSAQLTLATAYEEGKGIDRDLSKTVVWLEKAATRSLAESDMVSKQAGEAARRLGGIYRDGRGVEKNLAAAVEWYRRASLFGDEQAKVQLAEIERARREERERLAQEKRAEEERIERERQEKNDRERQAADALAVDHARDRGVNGTKLRTFIVGESPVPTNEKAANLLPNLASFDRGVDVSDGQPAAAATYHYHKGDGSGTPGRFDENTPGHVDSAKDLKTKTSKIYVKKKIATSDLGTSVDHGDIYIYVAAAPDAPKAVQAVALPRADGVSGNRESPKRELSSIGVGIAGLIEFADLERKPKVVKTRTPAYPFELQRAGVTGRVVVGIVIDRNGAVVEAVALEASRSEFAEPAVQAVKQWRFEPGQKDGRKVPTRMSLPIAFTIEE